MGGRAGARDDEQAEESAEAPKEFAGWLNQAYRP